MRPGRLDRILYVSPPNLEARKHIFRITFAKMAVNEDVNVDELAELVSVVSLAVLRPPSFLSGGADMSRSYYRQTDGCSGAECASVCQDAALEAMNEDMNAPNVRSRFRFRLRLTYCDFGPFLTHKHSLYRSRESTSLRLPRAFGGESRPRSFKSTKNGEIAAGSGVPRDTYYRLATDSVGVLLPAYHYQQTEGRLASETCV